MLRQTRLLSLRITGIIGETGAPDGVLQVIGRLSHLTRLYCKLQPYHAVLAGILQPFQLEPATDVGVQCLSSLQSLKDVTLINGQANMYEITGQSLSAIGSLRQLTHLSLLGWSMADTDLGHLTHLQLLSLELEQCWTLRSGCLKHTCLLTSLHSLSMHAPVGTEEELHIFKKLATEVLPFLTTLNLF